MLEGYSYVYKKKISALVCDLYNQTLFQRHIINLKTKNVTEMLFFIVNDCNAYDF